MPLPPLATAHPLRAVPLPVSARRRLSRPPLVHPMPRTKGEMPPSVSTGVQERMIILVPLKSTANVYNRVCNARGFMAKKFRKIKRLP